MYFMTHVYTFTVYWHRRRVLCVMLLCFSQLFMWIYLLVACFYLLQIICHCLFCRHIVVNMYFDDIIISVGKYEVAQSCKLLEDSVTHYCMLHCLSVGFTSCLFMLYTMPDNYCLL